MSTAITVNIKYQTWNVEQQTWNAEPKHETGAKNKNFGVFEKLLHGTSNNKHEISYLKYATANIKYEYLGNSEHTISNMKCRTTNC